MFERMSLKLGQFILGLKREEGQGATEYAMVIGLSVVGSDAQARLCSVSRSMASSVGVDAQLNRGWCRRRLVPAVNGSETMRPSRAAWLSDDLGRRRRGSSRSLPSRRSRAPARRVALPE